MDIDTSAFDELEEEFDKTISSGMQELAEEIEWTWRTTATKRHRASRDKYLEGFGVEVVGNEIQAKLTGLGAGMELGQDPYDLKPGFLAKGKPYPGGLYRIIPMGFPPEAPPAQPRFRTVTSNSQGWIHPGFGKEKHSRVSREVQEITDRELIPDVFNRLVGSIKI